MNPSSLPDTGPGQYFIPDFIIYRILGQPQIEPREWRLVIDGQVENKLELTLEELEKYPRKKDNHRLLLRHRLEHKEDCMGRCIIGNHSRKAKPKPLARWLYVESLDGHTTIIPLQDALH